MRRGYNKLNRYMSLTAAVLRFIPTSGLFFQMDDGRW
jgi:hypothetical protein